LSSNRPLSDAERALAALKGIDGKRLTYGGLKADKRAKRRISQRGWRRMLTVLMHEIWLSDPRKT